jgi:type IV pilus assembly protein PilX
MTRQRGATLIVALIFLVILSLLGVTVASNNSLQERMAANTRSRDIAFEAAEHALRAAELYLDDPDGDGNASNNASWLATNATAGDTDGDGDVNGTPDVVGLLSGGELHPNDATYWNTFEWDNAGVEPTSEVNSTTAAGQPRYVIERMGTSTSPYYFRVTASGLGRSSNTRVVLQTMYQY